MRSRGLGLEDLGGVYDESLSIINGNPVPDLELEHLVAETLSLTWNWSIW
jgi:hypothetical protein